jgi:RNA polymerase sigma-70 factor, ECF subfamily
MLDVKAGDHASFGLLLEKYRGPLVNFLYRMVHDRDAAEDLAQEAFLRVYRARRGYEPNAKFTTWLFRIATNLALNAARDGRHNRMAVSLDETGVESGLARELRDPGPNAEQNMLERDRTRLVWQAVGELPERQRAAILLHKYDDLGYEEIAKILGCSESALKSLLFRAYEALRVRLAPLVGSSAEGRQA